VDITPKDKMPLAERRDHIRSFVRKAIARYPGCGVVLSDLETRAIAESLRDSDIYEPQRLGNVIYIERKSP